ncbi:hypothetical protein V2J09_016347 [Rumex salicifolius]
MKVNATFYKQLVGSMMYATATRPDIMYAVSLISMFMAAPTELHLMIAKRILRNGKIEPVGFKDNDYAGISRTSNETRLNQREYCKAPPFPLSRGLKLSIDERQLLDRSLVGKLLYLNMTKLDISNIVQCLSQFMSYLRVPHHQATTHEVRYLHGVMDLADLNFFVFSDVNWGNYMFCGHSLTVFCIFLRPSLISWRIKKKNTVAKSSEYCCMAITSNELLHVKVLLPIPLYCDNKLFTFNWSSIAILCSRKIFFVLLMFELVGVQTTSIFLLVLPLLHIYDI